MANLLKISRPSNYFSKLIIIVFAVLQLFRLPRLPQFMDIYYHLQTAWGFIQSGGYSIWDFWEYAPFGRPHIYPPLFHILLALIMKLGVNVVFLAKFLEAVSPLILLLIIWNFIRENYNEQLGFFVTVAFCSSFTFFTFLSNHIPVCLALILGFLSLGELFKQRVLRTVILLSLCFYTHISVCWFFLITYVIYAILDKDYRSNSLKIIFYALLAALPILLFECKNLHFIRLVGNDFPLKFYLQIKVIDYILAGLGLFLAFKMAPRYRLFISLFLAGLIYAVYPYRFLSAEGYLPVIFLLAMACQEIWRRLKTGKLKSKRILMGILILFILFVSPTLILDKPDNLSRADYKVDWVDSVFSGIISIKERSLWFPRMYLPTAKIIKENSTQEDIVYSGINFSGVILSALSQRASANALLPEVRCAVQFDPLSVANIILLPKDLDEQFINRTSLKYKLAGIGESEYFWVFRNPYPAHKLKITRAAVGFPVIISILFILAVLFWAKELTRLFKK